MVAVAAIHICGILGKDGVYDDIAAYDSGNLRNPSSGELVPQGDMIIQMLAAERYAQYLEDCRIEQELLIDPRNAPSYDKTDPLTATLLCVLTLRYRYAVALETPYVSGSA